MSRTVEEELVEEEGQVRKGKVLSSEQEDDGFQSNIYWKASEGREVRAVKEISRIPDSEVSCRQSPGLVFARQTSGLVCLVVMDVGLGSR